MPLQKDNLVLHFICNNSTIRERLEQRDRKQEKNKNIYWDALRKETQKYYKDKCKYYKIDTSNLSIDDIIKIALKIINE